MTRRGTAPAQTFKVSSENSTGTTISSAPRVFPRVRSVRETTDERRKEFVKSSISLKSRRNEGTKNTDTYSDDESENDL